MLETLFSSTTADSLTLSGLLISLATALILGLAISLVYLYTHKAEGCSSGIPVTLIMVPAIIAIIIMLIGNNVARAFSLAGAFSLIRFRSAPGDPKDIAYVFFAVAAGLACGMGYLAYAAVFAVLLALVMLVLHKLNFAAPKADNMQLKITVPEDLNFQNLFNDILNKHTDSWSMKRVKTSDFGSLFEVAYNVRLKSGCDQKKLLDELRCRNGNLNILLTQRESEEKY